MTTRPTLTPLTALAANAPRDRNAHNARDARDARALPRPASHQTSHQARPACRLALPRLTLLRQALRLSLLGAPLTLALSVLAHAQTAPSAPIAAPPVDAGRVLQEGRPALPPAPHNEAPSPLITQPSEPAPLVLPGGQTLMVRAVRFEGDEFIPEPELQALAAPFMGRALSMADIEALADKVTALYRDRGYMVARAYVPKQDARNGTLTLRVVAGHYGKVTVQDHSLVRESQVSGYFAGLTGDRAVSRDQLERAMLLVSDLPGAALPTVSIAPGQAQGTSDFVVDVPAGKRYGGYALLDNYGSRYTGEGRLSVGASLYSPFGLGDSLDFSGMTTDSAGLVSGRLGYSAPLGTSGLRGGLVASTTHYRLGNVYAPLDAKGYANALEADLSYPVLRSRSQNLVATLGLVKRDLMDEIEAVDQTTHRHVYAGTLGLSNERWTQLGGHDLYLNLTGGLTWGRLNIDEAAMRAANQAGANTVGGFGHANVSALARVALTGPWSASVSVSGQRAFNRNLDSSEQFSISGVQGVMPYQEVTSGDNGYLANVELRYALPGFAPGVTHSVSVFADSGRVWLRDGSYAITDGVSMHDVGLGYALSYRSFFGRVRLARALGAWPASVPSNGRYRFLAQLGAVF